MPSPCSRDPQVQSKWRSLLVEHASSGLSVAAFARTRGVSRESLYKWRRWFRDHGESFRVERPTSGATHPASTALVQLHVEEPRRRGGRDRMTVELPCGTRLHLEPGFEPGAVSQLLGLLRAT